MEKITSSIQVKRQGENPLPVAAKKKQAVSEPSAERRDSFTYSGDGVARCDWKQAENEKAPGYEKIIHESQRKYAVAGLYARLAKAGTKSQVQLAMSEARREMGALRISASLGSKEDRMKAQASVRSLQKLLVRGSRKVRRLKEEELVRLRQKRAAALTEERKEMKLRLELQRIKNGRKTADRAIALEGTLDDMNRMYRFKKQDGENVENLSYNPSLPSEGVEAVSTDISAGEIVVSENISFEEI